MKCPRCESTKSNVIDSRGDLDVIRRRRICQGCDARFSTLERIEYNTPMIVKKDGRREPFSSDKVRVGITKACEKRPVSVEAIDGTVRAVERQLSEMCEKEIPAESVGQAVMEALRELDHIAYVRFASVYREFSDISQFMETLNNLIDMPGASGALERAKRVSNR